MVKSVNPNYINPVLQTAVSSLDLDLENELSRYRRLKNQEDSKTNYNSSPPKVMPLEAFGLTEVGSLVHQPEEDLSQQKKEELSGPENYFESSARLLNTLNQYDALQAEDLVLLTPVKTTWGISSLFIFIFGGFLLSLAFLPNEILANVPLINNFLVSEEKLSAPPVSEQKKNSAISSFNKNDLFQININNLSTLNIKKDSPSKVKNNNVQPPILATENTSTKPVVRPNTPNKNLASALLPSVSTSTQSFYISSVSSEQLNKSYFYVFTDFQGDNSLISARNIIPDAYLVQFKTGKKIQFGAFINQNDAQLLVQRLQNKGISAFVFRP